MRELAGAIEAVLFISGDPVARRDLCRALDVKDAELNAAVELLQEETEERGVRVVSFGDSVQMATHPRFSGMIDKAFAAAPRPPLSQSALEALSIVAYRQPVTRGDVDAVRGVKSDYAILTLVKRGLICEAGRKEALGRPILYATTDLFLRHFGAASLLDLPPLPESDEASLREGDDRDGSALGTLARRIIPPASLEPAVTC